MLRLTLHRLLMLGWIGLLTFCVWGMAWGQTDSVAGRVFHDLNGDGQWQRDEPGVPDVKVSNGHQVVLTQSDGSYVLPIREDMSVMVIQPAGWRVPVNAHQVPQFSYTHKPAGSATRLRFGGLEPTGDLPDAINFPITPSPHFDERFRCAVIGDSQTYSNDEIGFFRNSSLTDLMAMGLQPSDCMIYLGDVVGDDLGLLDRMMAVGGSVGVPQWFVFGNHDLDFDATTAADRADTWRAKVMPDYYAFEIGDVLFVALNNIQYPCGASDTEAVGVGRCDDPETPTYNARIDEVQLEWLSDLLALTPKNRRVVVMHHAPLVSFVDADSAVHQTNNSDEVHALLAGRPALSLSGHTHSLENHDPGQFFAGWETHAGVDVLPFRHIIAGAASGGWYQGDLDINGIPMALQRMGSPKGVLMLEFDGGDVVESYKAARIDATRQTWVGLNTPAFRQAHDALSQWMASDQAGDPNAIPPRSLHDLGDRNLLTVADLNVGVSLMVNVWLGSASTEVFASLDGGPPVALERTQAGQGESIFRGAQYADPFSTSRLMSVARTAVQSTQGDGRASGYETFKGRPNQGIPRPQGRSLPDHNMHLWSLSLPRDWAVGIHHIEITTQDRHRRVWTDHLLVEVVDERPPRFWRQAPWLN